MFTDLVGSSRLWQEYPDAMKGALAHHDVVLRVAVEGQMAKAAKAGDKAVERNDPRVRVKYRKSGFRRVK